MATKLTEITVPVEVDFTAVEVNDRFIAMVADLVLARFAALGVIVSLPDATSATQAAQATQSLAQKSNA